MKKGKVKKQKFTTAPQPAVGKKKMAGDDLGAIFGRSPKKPEADMPPRKRGSERSARIARLSNKFI